MYSTTPAQIISISGKRAKVSVKGILMDISIQLLDDVQVGDLILTHAGFGLAKIDEKNTLPLFKLYIDTETPE